MRKLRFLVPPGALDGGAGAGVDLPEEESHHLTVTLRAQAGLEVALFDGRGREWSGAVAEVVRGRPARIRLIAEQTAPVESPLRVTVYQALSLDRVFEESLEPLVALGVAVIVPLATERSRTGGHVPDAKRLARWRRIASEACKLSFRRTVPEIAPALAADAIPLDAGARSLHLDPDAPEGSLRAALAEPAPAAARLAIGPEGGFTEAEMAALARAGFASVRLGPRVLRTQHAGPAALAIVLAAWSDVG